MMIGEPSDNQPPPVGWFRRVLAVVAFMTIMPFLILAAVLIRNTPTARKRLEACYDLMARLVLKINPHFDV